MNQEQIGEAIRTLITMLLTAYATKLGIDGATIESIATALAVIIPYAWGTWARKNSNLIASAANVPNPSAPDGKTIVVTSSAIARDTPAENVVSSSDKIVLSK